VACEGHMLSACVVVVGHDPFLFADWDGSVSSVSIIGKASGKRTRPNSSEASIQAPDFHVLGRHVVREAVALLHPGDQVRLGSDLREIRFGQTIPLGLGVPHIAPGKKIIVLIVGNIVHGSFLDYRKVNASSIT
ncbi:MAG TPA: hypothetical protein VK434_05165, partial [Microvirga sp.]|nr:hypothetical protein [Microvirga sp.]